MNERLKMIRKHHKYTQAEMGQELGVSRDAVATYESGRVVPDKSIRMLICQKFNVNEDWLERGEGDPYREGLVPELVRALQCMPDVQALLEQKLPTVSDDTWRALNEVVRAFVSGLPQK